ncbi:hypothetical protein KDK82_1813 [Delftia sp. K82]|uniref:hypothetical protein n=1 Tax=Delftia sp. K82 TaxID=1472718 RepID=UPI000B48F39A|nr:hypothetical protein [Delftia sp. K82]OWG18334.1 hypothetical protein KDK82_1813 [Delftia sp. K82]
MNQETALIAQHDDVARGHRFSNVVYQGETWDLSHLDPYAFRAELKPDLTVDVVVFFSCHCFTHAEKKDNRTSVPAEEIFMEGHVRRVLNPERWRLSRELLPGLEGLLRNQQIRVLGGPLSNYAIFTATDTEGRTVNYGVFFAVTKDRSRRKRILLRVQSAYVVEELTPKLQKARKVNLDVLLLATYEGRKIKS